MENFQCLSQHVNSFQATKLSEKAQIIVKAIRESSQTTVLDECSEERQIESFEIIDLGDGFNSKNYNSFKTAESTHKAELGCKGVGRFTWLKAFETVEVDSTYSENSVMNNIQFNFSVNDADFNNITNEKRKLSDKSQTNVRLKFIKPPYRTRLPKTLDTIAQEIIQHCLIYFLENEIESFLLQDNFDNSIDLIDLYKETYSRGSNKIEFDIGDNSFNAYFIKNIKNRKQKIHKVFLCANSRSVRDCSINDYIEHLPPFFEDADLNKFNYSIYVTSSYFDEYVNQERTSFSIAEKDAMLLEEHPAINTIIIKLMEDGIKIFEPYLEPMYVKHREMVGNYVDTKGYEYRHILKNRPNWIKNIPFDLIDEKLDVELHKLTRDYELELKTEAIKLKDDLKQSKVGDYEAYKDSLKKYTDDLNEIGKSNLAKYIVHRKAVIDAFEVSLELQEDSDKYALEDAVHDIIMPIRSKSDEVKDHNLWLIDERMSYHNMLISDKSFKSSTNIESNERPDLLIFNNPIVYSDDKNNTSTAIIIEFKRPMRNDCSDDDNPIDQVIGYVKKLRNQKGLENDKGRVVQLDKIIPIYCYVICDLTTSVRELLDSRNFKPLFDNQGYMFYHDNHNAMIEVISFDKLLNDAKKRNKVLFKKLNLA